MVRLPASAVTLFTGGGFVFGDLQLLTVNENLLTNLSNYGMVSAEY
jgi:hypothetical protein